MTESDASDTGNYHTLRPMRIMTDNNGNNTDDNFTKETGSTLRSLLNRFTATERFPVDDTVARREYRGIELITSVEIAHDDLSPDSLAMKIRVIECVAVTDDGQTIAKEASTMTVGESPRWFGLFGGDHRAVPSTSTHALDVIEPVREAVDEFLVTKGIDPELAAALDVELGELSSRPEQSTEDTMEER